MSPQGISSKSNTPKTPVNHDKRNPQCIFLNRFIYF
jgi:hypothetical protein